MDGAALARHQALAASLGGRRLVARRLPARSDDLANDAEDERRERRERGEDDACRGRCLAGLARVLPRRVRPGTNVAAASANGSALQNTAHVITAATPRPSVQARRLSAGMRGTNTSTSSSITAIPNSDRPIQPPTSASPPMMPLANSSAITMTSAIAASNWVRGMRVSVLMRATTR
jgi:hypothetical protein